MELSWHDPGRLAAELRALPQLDDGALAASQSDFLIDAWVPNAPLLISFAFVDWDKPAAFYFFGRSKKLEQLRDQRFNRILLRDRRNRWYLQGVPGLGDSVAQVVGRLRLLVAAIAPSAIWCIGESMGGYAAIIHGILLQAERIVSFGALSTFSPRFAEQFQDRRWLGTMTELDDSLTENSDLPALARRHAYRGKLYLVQGTHAGERAPQAVNLDVMHSQRYAGLGCAHFHYYPQAEHTVTLWLAQHQQFDGLLLHCLFDAPNPTALAKLPQGSKPIAAPALHTWPREFPALDRISVAAAAPDIDVLVHRVTPGAPLLICFADAPVAGAPPGFDHYDVHAQCERATGKPLNQILLRDSHGQAWLRGCCELGNSADSVAANLRKLIALIQPSRILCVGHGIGGYAAILFAELLGAQGVLAFDPLTLLDIRLADLWHDERYRHVLAAIGQAPAAPGPRDLLPLLARYRGEVRIVCATAAQGEGYDAGSHDSVHAQRVAMLPNVEVQPSPGDGATLRWMRDQILVNLIIDKNDKTKAWAAPTDDIDLSSKSARSFANLFQPAGTGLAHSLAPTADTKIDFALDFSIEKISGKG
jgi:predicted esterase YcpF (UPF0227 family)